LKEFENRGISNKLLKKWLKSFSAIYPWNACYDIFRQNINRRFVFFPWLISMTHTEKEVVCAFKAAIKYNIPFVIRSGSHAYEPYSLVDGIII